MEVNGYHQLSDYQHSSKMFYFLFNRRKTCSGLEQLQGDKMTKVRSCMCYNESCVTTCIRISSRPFRISSHSTSFIRAPNTIEQSAQIRLNQYHLPLQGLQARRKGSERRGWNANINFNQNLCVSAQHNSVGIDFIWCTLSKVRLVSLWSFVAIRTYSFKAKQFDRMLLSTTSEQA